MHAPRRFHLQKVLHLRALPRKKVGLKKSKAAKLRSSTRLHTICKYSNRFGTTSRVSSHLSGRRRRFHRQMESAASHSQQHSKASQGAMNAEQSLEGGFRLAHAYLDQDSHRSMTKQHKHETPAITLCKVITTMSALGVDHSQVTAIHHCCKSVSLWLEVE